jgi:chaperonin GroEL
VALINAISALDSVEAQGDILTGVNILRRALEEPMRTIAANAGQDGSVAGLLITTEAMVADRPEPKGAAGMPAGGGMGGMGGMDY